MIEDRVLEFSIHWFIAAALTYLSQITRT